MKIPAATLNATQKLVPDRLDISNLRPMAARCAIFAAKVSVATNTYISALTPNSTGPTTFMAGGTYAQIIFKHNPLTEYCSDGYGWFQNIWASRSRPILFLPTTTARCAVPLTKGCIGANTFVSTCAPHLTGPLASTGIMLAQIIFNYNPSTESRSDGYVWIFNIRSRWRYTPTWFIQVVHLALHGYLESCCTANSI